ncbi:ATP-dependent RNA helicase DBP4 [Wickerhamiella sorbophila]|uniref:ATP-dependent RNA helicase n=1 Tax=Wickerhamiella sorbophila TaxID=45607 RepID=A0A2T0FFG4_9ASCO|nr:ATP-dependent RNA helicase DBP4 [Wickerhamiella sorbophila]PRT53728.1 ATP-dependent RNA helicase DBP4 [Wickerhamiella sorbophila]
MAKKRSGKNSRLQSENEALEKLKEEVQQFDYEKLTSLEKFEDLPLSAPTQKGLHSAHFTKMTDIQKEAILPALQNIDILGAARTGSGKTLAFLIPVLEKLWYEKWTQHDGLGAIVITPTRELASQIFGVLKKIGKFHAFSAGLLIGGHDVKMERDRVSRLNILICTPGRLLQHMDESPGFDATNLQTLVLDEADRILDMGFKRTLDAIIDNLPPSRQSLLFSATQTKSVNDLARLSLVSPKYISVDEEQASTPQSLEQYVTIVKLGDKLDTLWSFLRSHTKNKILVFMSSSKQVRFVYEGFRRLQPGIPLLHLHGRQKQTARSEITDKFSRSRASCLFSTDVVARGIDFPEVDWVIQIDCPEDSATYIHRVGRSARAGKKGRALLFLTSSEEGFIENLTARKIPIQTLTVREAKKSSIQPDLQAQCFQDPELKYTAQKAFISYVRSIYLQKDKNVFDVEALDLEGFAKSLGLASAPNVKIKGVPATNNKNKPRALMEHAEKPDRVRTKYDRMFQRQNQNVLSEHYQKLAGVNDESEEDFMSIKRQGHEIDEEKVPQLADNTPASKRAQKKALSKKQTVASKPGPTKLVFDEEGNAHPIYELEDEEDFKKAGDAEAQRQNFVEGESKDMEVRDLDDKGVAKEKRLEKKRRRKELERLAKEGFDSSDDDETEFQVRLPSESEAEDEEPRKKSRRTEEPIEIDEPETLEDLEALSAKLLRAN